MVSDPGVRYSDASIGYPISPVGGGTVGWSRSVVPLREVPPIHTAALRSLWISVVARFVARNEVARRVPTERGDPSDVRGWTQRAPGT
jgi:hypothetical protein